MRIIELNDEMFIAMFDYQIYQRLALNNKLINNRSPVASEWGGAFCQKEAQQLGTQVGNLLANQDRSDLEYRDKPNKHAKKQPSHRNKPSETHINTDVNRSIKLAFWGLR